MVILIRFVNPTKLDQEEEMSTLANLQSFLYQGRPDSPVEIGVAVGRTPGAVHREEVGQGERNALGEIFNA